MGVDTNRMTNSWEFLNILRVIFYIVLSSLLMLFLVLFYLFKDQEYSAPAPTLHDSIKLVVPILVLALIGWAFIWYFRKLPMARTASKLRDRLKSYLRLNLMKFGILSLAGFIALCAFYLTGVFLYGGVFILVLIAFAVNNPTVHVIIRELRLKDTERELFLKNLPLPHEH